MKKLLAFAIFSLIVTELGSQQLQGKYINKEHYEDLKFTSNNYVEFNLESGGCLSYSYAGKGYYKKFDNHIYIQPIRPKHLTLPVEKLKKSLKSDSSLVVKVFDNNGVLFEGATVILMKNNKIQVAKVTDKNGNAILISNRAIKDLELRCMYVGFSPVSYTIGENKWDYNVHFEDNTSFEDIKKFYNNAGKGLEIRIQKDTLFINRLRPRCDRKDSCYEWREYIRVGK